MSVTEKINIVKAAIKEYPDFPKPGIMFQDIFGVLADPKANQALDDLAAGHAVEHAAQVDKVVPIWQQYGPCHLDEGHNFACTALVLMIYIIIYRWCV